MRLIAIDPGTTKGHAYAAFVHGALLQASRADDFEAVSVNLVLIEQPRWHKKAANSPAIVNDLIDLGIAVGMMKEKLEQEGNTVELVPASRWKGTVPKPIMNQRVYERLTAEERVLLPLKRGAKKSRSAVDHDHNVIDAIGLGLWKLGRLYGAG